MSYRTTEIAPNAMFPRADAMHSDAQSGRHDDNNQGDSTGHPRNPQKPLSNGQGLHIRILDEIKHYDDCGFRIVPLRIGYTQGKKQPFFPGSWNQKVFSSADCGSDCNGIFILTGSQSNLMVIDFDHHDEQLGVLLRHFGLNLGEFCHARTPSGGVHIYVNNSHVEYWLKRYERNTLTTTNKRLGIDVRCENAGVFAPCTMIEGYGSYRWNIPPYDTSRLEYENESISALMDAIYNPPKATENRALKPRLAFQQSGGAIDEFAQARDLVYKLAQIEIDYSDWIKIGMSLRGAFGARGKELWDIFVDNPNYRDTGEILNRHWRSFGGAKVRLGSLYYTAAKYGIRIDREEL